MFSEKDNLYISQKSILHVYVTVQYKIHSYLAHPHILENTLSQYSYWLANWNLTLTFPKL